MGDRAQLGGRARSATSAIPAIQTRYAGCHFRSRLEARWAVFFDALGIRWEYEQEGFVGQRGEQYLPDFHLPDMRRPHWCEGRGDLGIYVEVKGSDDALRADGRRIGAAIDYQATPISDAGLLILGDVPRGDAWATLHSFLYWHKGVAHRHVRLMQHGSDDGSWLVVSTPAPWMSWGDDGADENVPEAASTVAVCLEQPRMTNHQGPQLWRKPQSQDPVDNAYRAARAARFEHGQSGAA